MAKATTTTESKLVTAKARGLHIAPRKMRLVTNAVKNKSVGDALTQLAHMNKKAAPMVAKLIRSAAANAEHNFSLDPERLFVKSITADMGSVMKRYFPRARGSAFIIRRKLSHINVVLEERGKAQGTKLGSFIRKTAKSVHEPSVDALDSTNAKPKQILGRKSQVSKTEEQVKENRSQNKRRLFNRKSGE